MSSSRCINVEDPVREAAESNINYTIEPEVLCLGLIVRVCDFHRASGASIATLAINPLAYVENASVGHAVSLVSSPYH